MKKLAIGRFYCRWLLTIQLLVTVHLNTGVSIVGIFSSTETDTVTIHSYVGMKGQWRWRV